MDAASFKAQLLSLLSSCVRSDTGRGEWRGRGSLGRPRGLLLVATPASPNLHASANVVDVVTILRDELHMDAKQVNAIVNLARASGEEVDWSDGLLDSSIFFSWRTVLPAGDESRDNSVNVAAVAEHAFDALRQLIELDSVRPGRPPSAFGAPASRA